MAKQHAPRFLALVETAKRGVREISVDEVLAWRQAKTPHVLVDVREDREWQASHAEDAVHLGRGVLERDVEQAYPDPATPLILYCGGGFRSALAAESLQKMGYTDVRSMAGGWSEWQARGGPIAKP